MATDDTAIARESYKRERAELRDFNWAIGLNRTILRLIGIWPEGKSQKSKTLRVPIMVLWLLFGLFLPQMYALSMVYHQLPLVVDNFTTSCAALTSSVKLFLLWNKRRVLEPVIDSVMVDWTRPRSSWETSVMRKQARRARVFTMSGYVIMFVCFVSFVVTPFFGLSIRIVNNITDPDGDRFFPLQTAYPYASEKSPYFELTYLVQLVAGSFVGISFTVPDNFFSALVFHACGKCEILRAKLRTILSSDSDTVDRRTINEKRKLSRVRQCVRAHVRLIRFVSAIENSFSELILVQVLCLTMVICCLGFGVISSVKSKTEQLPIIQIVTLSGTLINLMIHMLVYCMASEILADHSSGFTQDIYSSAWYSPSTSCARDIVLIMIRSRFPLRLTAGKFFYLSLNAYLAILKNSLGYISMLTAVSS